MQFIASAVYPAACILALAGAGCDSSGTLGLGLVGAAQRGKIDRVKEIVAQNADAIFETDDKGNTAVIWAILNGHNEVAVYLLDQGYPIDGDARVPYPPLMACLSRHHDESLEMLEILLKRGANPNIEFASQGWLAITMAVSNDMPEKVRLLAEYGADLDRRAPRGKFTALEFARETLAQMKDPNFDYPHGELSDPKIRAEHVARWEMMVQLLQNLKKK
jgi:ankyrin repeat protein